MFCKDNGRKAMLKSKVVAGVCALATSIVVPVMGTVPGVGAAGSFAYSTQRSAEGGCSLVKVDLATAEVSTLPALPDEDACVRDLAATADGTPWGIGEKSRAPGGGGETEAVPGSLIQLVQFDPVTGAVADTTELPGVEYVAKGGIAVGTDGTVYIQAVSDRCDTGASVCLFTVDPATGATTVVGSSGQPETDFYYLANCDGLVSVYLPELPQFVNVSSTDGSTSDAGSLSDTLWGYDCAGDQRFALEGGFLSDNGSQSTVEAVRVNLVTFDPATGATELVASIDPSDADLNTLALVPEMVQPTTTTTGAPTTTSTNPAVQSVTAQPKFTG
jgi:hypothetical protein